MGTCSVCGIETPNRKYCSRKCMGKDPHRTEIMIKNLPITYWTNQEEELLRQNYGILHIDELCRMLNRNRSAVIAHAQKRGVASKRYWTEEQTEFLRQNHMADYDYLCSSLGKSLHAIQHRMHHLGLKRNPKWTKSRLETEFESILKELGITEFKYQYQAGHGVYDYLIGDTLVEVQGNYWHCNPKFFPNGPIDDRQVGKLARDKDKREMAQASGFDLIYVWEDDVYNDREYVKQQIAVLKSGNIGEPCDGNTEVSAGPKSQ